MSAKIFFVLLALAFGVSSCVTTSPTMTACKELYDAAARGSMQDVAASLDRSIPVDEACYGFTALGAAAYYGHSDVVKLLLDRGSNIEGASPGAPTALGFAAMQGHSTIVKILIDKGAIVQTAIDGLERQTWMGESDLRCKAGIKLLERLRGNLESIEPVAPSARVVFNSKV